MHPDTVPTVLHRLARLVAAAVFLAPLLQPAVSRADATPGQLAYLAGVRSYEVADYATAVGKLREALRSDASEALRKFRATGLKEEDYLPHFYLGLSLEKLGAREEALVELRESERQGAIRGKAGSLRLLEAAISRLSPPPRVVETPTAAPLPVREVATPPPTVVPPAPVPAPTATGVPVPTALVERRPVSSTQGPTRPSIEPRRTASPVPTPGLPGSAGELRAQLREGLRAFFRAEYRQATVRLEPLAGADVTARAFLAFSLAGQYLVGDRRDAALLARARTEYETATAGGLKLPSPEKIPEALREAVGAR